MSEELAVVIIIALWVDLRLAIGRALRRLKRHGERLDKIDGGDDSKPSGSHGALTLGVAALIGTAALFLSGCTLGSKELKQLETGEVRGTFNGQPLAIAWRRDTTGQMVFDINVPMGDAAAAAAKVAAAGAAGGATGGPWGAIAGILGALGAAGAAYGKVQHTRASEHRHDADEGWRLYREQVEAAAAVARNRPTAES